MPYVRVEDGTRLHYQVAGRQHGEPVLLIQGLGADMTGWALQRLALSAHHRTAAIDNRGAGRSDKPFGRYSLEQMADDAVAVLDATGIDKAHVVGASMGGAISQLVAFRHPDRVRSLTLMCTACRHHAWRRELLAEWAAIANERGVGEMARRAAHWLVAPRSLRRFWPALGLLGPLAMSLPAYAFSAQVRAILDHPDAEPGQLSGIHVPTLVLVGSQDILTPRGDSEELAEGIPGSELVVIAGAAHGLMVEHATTVNRILLDFLRRVESETAASSIAA